MRVSIQIALLNGWDKNAPSFHDFKTWKDATDFAENLSHCFCNSTVRVCKIDVVVPETHEAVSRLSGTYIQSRLDNKAETADWVQKLLNK